ncbi:MAG: hypothetical protein AAGA47_02845 [Pseudomonadota bacterium]
MFRDWEFLIGELWFLLALAAFMGLSVGWIIWGRWGGNSASGEAAALRADLDRCRAMHSDKDARIAALEAETKTEQVTASIGEFSDHKPTEKPTRLAKSAIL